MNIEQLADAIPLNEDDLDQLAQALGISKDDVEAFEERLASLSEFALHEYVDWILARRRFESPSALDRHRILEIFGSIREEAPTVEKLVDDLGVSESRAVSLLSRLRYGHARLVRRLQYKAAATEIRECLQIPEEHEARLHLGVTPDTGRIIDEANTAIMMAVIERQPGGRYEGAEKAVRVEAARTGHFWSSKEAMWDMILEWIDARA